MKTLTLRCSGLLLAMLAAFGIASAVPMTVRADDRNLPTIGWSKFAKQSKFLIGMSDKVLKERFGDPGHIAPAIPDDIPKCGIIRFTIASTNEPLRIILLRLKQIFLP